MEISKTIFSKSNVAFRVSYKRIRSSTRQLKFLGSTEYSYFSIDRLCIYEGSIEFSKSFFNDSINNLLFRSGK